jgi:hypothetical protein
VSIGRCRGSFSVRRAARADGFDEAGQHRDRDEYDPAGDFAGAQSVGRDSRSRGAGRRDFRQHARGRAGGVDSAWRRRPARIRILQADLRGLGAALLLSRPERLRHDDEAGRQHFAGVNMQAIAEAVAFGEKAGLDRRLLFEVLAQTAVVSPAHQGKLPRAEHRDYSPQFPLRLMNKDFRLILDKAARLYAPMPAKAAAFQINVARAAKSSEEDFSSVIDEMEKSAAIDRNQTKAG